MGPQKALALPMFHVLTGCDTVSAFTNHGKRTALITWNSFLELTEALLVKLIFHATFYSGRDYEDHRKVCHFNV